MASEKVKKIVNLVSKLSPAGQDLIKTIMTGERTGMLKNLDDIQKTAKKYGAKVSIGFEDKEVVIADERGGVENMDQSIPVVNERKVENASPVDTIFNLENLIKQHAEVIDKLTIELKKNREMYEDSFNSNPAYRELVDKSKEATKTKLSVRSQIAKQPSVAQLKMKVDDLKFDISEQKKTLSDLLIDYKEQTKATQLELFNGQIFNIVQSVKLVKGSVRK